MGEALYRQLMDRAFRLLSRKARSRMELRAKLLERARGDEGVVERVITRLEELGYLDDRRLASEYAVTRLQAKPMGRRRLRDELRRKQVSDDVIEAALDHAYEQTDEGELLTRAIRKWVRTRGAPTTRAEAKRLFDHLARLGFEYEQIRHALREIWPFSSEEEEPLEVPSPPGPFSRSEDHPGTPEELPP